MGGTARVDGGAPNPIAVSRVGASTFVALSLICPHTGYKPTAIASAGFRCPNHGAQLAADGGWTGDNARRTSRRTRPPTTPPWAR